MTAVLEADDLAGSVLDHLDAAGVPVRLDSGFTQAEISNWRAGPCGNLTPLDAVRALQVATYTGKGVAEFAELVALRMHDAQQALAFDPADRAATEEAEQLTKALLVQHSDVRLEVLRQHPAMLSVDDFVDPIFFVASQHIFGASALLHEIALRHRGTVKVSTSDGAIAAALSLHLPNLPAVCQVSCDGTAFSRQNNFAASSNGVVILQAVASAEHVTALELHGKCWAAGAACKAALARCTQLQRLHLRVPNTKMDERGCLSALDCLTQLTYLHLGKMHWADQSAQQQNRRLHLRLPQLEELHAHAIPSPDSLLPKLRSIKHICDGNSASEWRYRLAPGEHAVAGDDDGTALASALCTQLTAIELTVVHRHLLSQLMPRTAWASKIENLCSLTLRCPVQPGWYGKDEVCATLDPRNRYVQACSVQGTYLEADDAGNILVRGWMVGLALTVAKLSHLQRFELLVDNTLISRRAAVFFARRAAMLRHLRVVMLPGIVSQLHGIPPADAEDADDGSEETTRVRQFQATLAGMRAEDAEASAPGEFLKLQRWLNVCVSLRQLAFVQPTGLECQRHMPGLRDDIEVHSVTQQQVWRGHLPAGWCDSRAQVNSGK